MNCCCHPNLEDLTGRLRRGELKLTRPRRAVIAALQAQRRPLAIKEIFSGFRPGVCDLASVYRSIRALEAAGVVKAFAFGDGVERYELIAEGDDGHHHHLICNRCRSVTEISECELREIDLRLAASKGFRAVTHRLEFFGICPACQ